MALIVNGVRLAQGNARYMGGNAATSGAYNAERAVAWSAGARKNFAFGEARVVNITNRAAVPEGYVHPYCHSMAQKSGGLAARNKLLGDGEITSGNLAGGLNAVAPLAGDGDITDAALGLILSAVAALVGEGVLTGDIVGVLQAAAALSGAGDITAALGALADLVAALTGNGTLAGSSTAKATISADIVVTGDVLSTANVAAAVWEAVAEGTFTYQQVMKILAAVAAGKTDIVDLGGGNATVTFRNLNDSVDRVVADMVGSERSDLTFDVDD